jgi:hypothetical protein
MLSETRKKLSDDELLQRSHRTKVFANDVVFLVAKASLRCKSDGKSVQVVVVVQKMQVAKFQHKSVTINLPARSMT